MLSTPSATTDHKALSDFYIEHAAFFRGEPFVQCFVVSAEHAQLLPGWSPQSCNLVYRPFGPPIPGAVGRFTSNPGEARLAESFCTEHDCQCPIYPQRRLITTVRPSLDLTRNDPAAALGIAHPPLPVAVESASIAVKNSDGSIKCIQGPEGTSRRDLLNVIRPQAQGVPTPAKPARVGPARLPSTKTLLEMNTDDVLPTPPLEDDQISEGFRP